MFCILLYRQGLRIEEAASTLVDTASEFEQAENCFEMPISPCSLCLVTKGNYWKSEIVKCECLFFFVVDQIPNCELWAGLLSQKIPMISSC